MARLGLSARIFVTIALVVLAGAGTLLLVALLLAPQVFDDHLAATGLTLDDAENAGVRDGFTDAVVTSIVAGVSAAVLVAVIAAALVARRLTGPLALAAQTATRLADGDLGARMPQPGMGPELAELGRAVNTLAARLEQAELRRERLLTDVAHELRTPLTAIRAQVEALDGELPEHVQPRFDNILEATNRSSRLIAQLLDVTRSQSLDLTGDPGSRIDLVEFAQSVVAGLVPAANRRKVEITLDSPRSAAVMTRPDLLAIVLRNLVENAVKYAASPGRVVVTVIGGEPGMTDLLVEDDGPGLSVEAFERAFERFQRLGRSGGDGVGLGLSIVAELCLRMGVPVDRLEPGTLGGLHVRLRLPAAPPPPDRRTSHYG